ncbi:MAG: rRNA pseudouridine synthase [Deltaproteobacteria bacterium]|nr:rRNA pseudouridine synthase [Deltaproteobacteria bacterium]
MTAAPSDDLARPRRLDKWLADGGAGSHAEIAALLASGRVAVGGVVEHRGSRLVIPAEAGVTIDGAVVEARRPQVYALLHKPAGYLTTLADPKGRRTVAALLPPEWRVGVVGRLDRPTTGALLVTDDGDLNNLLTSPDSHVWKRYRLTVVGELEPGDPRLQQLRDGVVFQGTRSRPARCGVVEGASLPGRDGTRLGVLWLEISEGRFRQVRKMATQVGFKVVRLHREAIGPLPLGDLAEGAWRMLTDAEVEALYAVAGGREAPATRAWAALLAQWEAGALEAVDAGCFARCVKHG